MTAQLQQPEYSAFKGAQAMNHSSTGEATMIALDHPGEITNLLHAWQGGNGEAPNGLWSIQTGSLAESAKAFMKSASIGITEAIAKSLVEALADTESRAEGLNPQDLQEYVEGLNMKWEWNTPKGTSLSTAVTAVVQPYESSSDQGPADFPTPKSLKVGVGIEF